MYNVFNPNCIQFIYYTYITFIIEDIIVRFTVLGHSQRIRNFSIQLDILRGCFYFSVVKIYSNNINIMSGHLLSIN